MEQRYDVAVVGGGLVGLTLAAALGRVGVRVALIEQRPLEAMVDLSYDGRTTAVAHGAQCALAGIGAWPRIADHACPILDIRVSDGRMDGTTSPLFLHYDHTAVGDQPMGHIVENRWLRRGLMDHLAEIEAVTILSPRQVADVSEDAGGAAVSLDDGSTVRASVVAAADGRQSPIRHARGVATWHHAYRQTALIAVIGHARPHGNVAHERFLPAGPFAILPMVDDPTDEEGAGTPHRSSIVWTECADLAAQLVDADDAAFLSELQRRVGDFLGEVSLAGPRHAYPLSLHLAGRYVDGRVALVGEAAHGIHPIAGQGLNMGWRDAAALAEAVVDALRLGLDPGSPHALAAYQARRRFDNMSLATVTDVLNRLFSNDLTSVRRVRDVGLAVVDRLPAVKRTLMRHAMGVLGDVPRLFRGEAL